MLPENELDVLVVGELNADLILRGNVSPDFGQVEKLVEDAVLTLGSSSAICACGLARLGLRVGFIGKVGDDEFGQFVLKELRAHHVETSGVIVDPGMRTGLTVVLSRGGDRAMLTYLGCIGALRYEDIDLAALPKARHLHLGSYFLLDGLRPDLPALFSTAKQFGLTLSLDTNYDPHQTWNGLDAVLQYVDVFIPNEIELCAISRVVSVEMALATLAQCVPNVVVKLGARGAVAQYAHEIIRADSLPVETVDTVGAGDSFDAGFIYGFLAGWAMPRVLRFASICGSLSTRAAGGTAAQPTLNEALAFL